MDTPADLSFVTLKDFAEFLGKESELSVTATKAKLTDALGSATEAVEAIVGPLDNGEHTFTVTSGGSTLILADSRILEPVSVVGPDGNPVALDARGVDLVAGVLTWRHRLAEGPHKVTYTTREHGYSVKMALKVIASHLYDVYRGNLPTYPADAYTPIDDPLAAKAGFAIPRRASQLLTPFVRGT